MKKILTPVSSLLLASWKTFSSWVLPEIVLQLESWNVWLLAAGSFQVLGKYLEVSIILVYDQFDIKNWEQIMLKT